MLALLLASAAAAQTIMAPPTLDSRIQSADRIVTGKVISIEDPTPLGQIASGTPRFEIKDPAQVKLPSHPVHLVVEEWIRDRTHEKPPRIRALRTAQGGCIVYPLTPYEIGARYLLLMQKAGVPGVDGDFEWHITWELPLPNLGFCVEGPGEPSPLPDAGSSCRRVVLMGAFVDALRTFENCFAVGDDLNGGTSRLSQSCTDEQLRSWSARSPIHSWLTETTLERIRGHAQR